MEEVMTYKIMKKEDFLMGRNEVYKLLMNFAKGVKADTTVAEQVMGMGRAIKILDTNIRAVANAEQRAKYNKLCDKIEKEYVLWS